MLRWAKKKKDRLKLCTIYQHQITFPLPYHSSTNFWLNTCVKTNVITKNKKYHNELQWHSLPWLQTIQRIQAARLSLDILDLMYDLSTTGKGFPSDVNLAIWKITWHSRLSRFTLQQNIHVAYFLLEVIID